MSTALLTHPASLELITFAKSSSIDATSRTPLSLPSRFPTSHQPQITISPSTGHAFLYCTESYFVWEYDSRGRRIGEMSFPIIDGMKIKGIRKALALGKGEGRERVVVCFNGVRDLQIMEKGDAGKWNCVKTFDGPGTSVTALAADLSMIVVGSENGEVVLYDQTRGTRELLPTSKPLTSVKHLAFSPTLTATVVASFTRGKIVVISLPTSSRTLSTREFNPFGPGQDGIIDLAFSPLTVTSDGSRKGGLCAVLRSATNSAEVALVGLGTPDSASRLVTFGQPLTSLVFLDGATLAGGNTQGVYTKDLRALTKPASEYPLSESVIDIKVLPALPKTARMSSAKSIPTTGRTAFGESRHHNVENQTPVPVSSTNLAKLKGKETAVRPNERRVTISATVEKERNDKVEYSEKVTSTATSGKTRVVSAPEPIKPNRSSGTRSLSGPGGPSRPPPTVMTLPTSSSGSRGPTPIIEEVEEEDEEVRERSRSVEADGVHLAWALRPAVSRREATSRISDGKAEIDWEAVEIMRRDLANLQLDMLRMGRGLKNEIRRAVQPLAVELKEKNEVIERQRREIERLRRGY